MQRAAHRKGAAGKHQARTEPIERMASAELNGQPDAEQRHQSRRQRDLAGNADALELDARERAHGAGQQQDGQDKEEAHVNRSVKPLLCLEAFGNA